MKPPDGLSVAGLALFGAIDAFLDELGKDYDPHEVAILVEACRVADRLTQLRDRIDVSDWSEAAIVRLLSEERMQRLALGTLLVSKLGLPTGLGDVGQSTSSRHAAQAANARWSSRTPGAATDAARKAANTRWRANGA